MLLIIERLVGIGWDFHPDSVTYATLSHEMAAAIKDDWILIFNNGYYFAASVLQQDVYAITTMNILAFSTSNVLIYRAIKESSPELAKRQIILLLLLNPYRIHLSTTMLKDTLIIFFLIYVLTSPIPKKILGVASLLTLRLVSPLYLLSIIPRKHAYYVFAIGLTAGIIIGDPLVQRILEFNSQDMQLRSFDTVPTFQNLGFWGAILRGVVWSGLAFTGAFALISPAPAYIPVAIGSLMTLIFLKKATGSYRIPIQILLATILFGIMVTGFTAYIRYIYPLLVVWPLVAISKNA